MTDRRRRQREVTGEVEFFEDDAPHALYRMYGAHGTLLYVGITVNLSRRMAAHAAEKPWWPLVSRRTMKWYPSESLARAAEAIAIDTEKPTHNKTAPVVGSHAPSHGDRHGWHRTPLLAWHPSVEDAEWVRSYAEKRGVALKVILDEALTRYREQSEKEAKS